MHEVKTMPPDANKLMTEFIDTHPKFMSTWPLKNRQSLQSVIALEPINEFMTEFLKWYDEQPKKNIYLDDNTFRGAPWTIHSFIDEDDGQLNISVTKGDEEIEETYSRGDDGPGWITSYRPKPKVD